MKFIVPLFLFLFSHLVFACIMSIEDESAENIDKKAKPNNSQKYATNKLDVENPRADVQPSPKSQLVYEGYGSNREEGNKKGVDKDIPKQDLEAQNRMANAADRAVWISGIATFIAFIGAVFLFITIRQSRGIHVVAEKTLAQTRESDARINRAILEVEIKATFDISDFTISGNDNVHNAATQVNLAIELKNTGKTFATRPYFGNFTIGALGLAGHDFSAEIINGGHPLVATISPDKSHACVIGIAGDISNMKDITNETIEHIIINCFIGYRDAFCGAGEEYRAYATIVGKSVSGNFNGNTVRPSDTMKCLINQGVQKYAIDKKNFMGSNFD